MKILGWIRGESRCRGVGPQLARDPGQDAQRAAADAQQGTDWLGGGRVEGTRRLQEASKPQAIKDLE